MKIASVYDVLKDEWIKWFGALAIDKKQGTERTKLLDVIEPIWSDRARKQKASRSLK
jgi:hypothetical protein